MEFARVIRFGVAGAFATGLHAALAAALIMGSAIAPPLANALAFTFASTASYVLTTYWTFGSSATRRSGLRFAITAVASAALAALISGIAAARGAHFALGILAVVCTVPVFTYFMHKHFTYRS